MIFPKLALTGLLIVLGVSSQEVNAKQAVAGDGLAEKGFVLGFDAGHVEQVFHTLLHSEFLRESSRYFIFDDIPAFQPPGKIHRHKPARQKTRRTERTPESPEDLLTHSIRLCFQRFKPPPDPLAMMPFLRLDLFDLRPFGGFLKRFPMPAISKRRRDLAGVGVPENADQVFAGIVQFKMICGLVVDGASESPIFIWLSI